MFRRTSGLTVKCQMRSRETEMPSKFFTKLTEMGFYITTTKYQ